MARVARVRVDAHNMRRVGALTFRRMDSYFTQVGDKLDLRPHCRFDTVVKQAHWDDQLHLWHVTAEGKEGVYKASARYLMLCIVRLSTLFVQLN